MEKTKSNGVKVNAQQFSEQRALLAVTGRLAPNGSKAHLSATENSGWRRQSRMASLWFAQSRWRLWMESKSDAFSDQEIAEIVAFFCGEPTPAELAEMRRAADYENREAQRKRPRKRGNHERKVA